MIRLALAMTLGIILFTEAVVLMGNGRMIGALAYAAAVTMFACGAHCLVARGVR